MASKLKGISQPKKFSFEWKIKRLFADCEKVGDCYKSSMYPILYRGKLTKWSLEVYPKGTNDENKHRVSIYLCLCSETSIEVSVDYQFYANGRIVGKKKITDTFEGSTYSSVWDIEQNIFKDANNDILIDDTLTIAWEITFHPQVQDDAKYFSGYVEWLDAIKNGFGDYEKLLESGDFTDVTFNVQDKQINSHKAILSCRSSVFEAMFSHEMKENVQNSVEITDIGYDVMKELLRFIYSGKVENIEKIASELLIAADKYQVKELKALCENTIYDELTVDNALEYLKLTEMCDTIYLKKLLINFAAYHYKKVIEKPGFEDLHGNVMHKILRAIAKNN